MSAAWEPYVHLIQHKDNQEVQGGWGQINICSHACIYGHDGNVWAASKNFTLSNYQTPVSDESGKETMMACNEHAALMKACDGNRKPQECGIRICNEKYTFNVHSPADDRNPFPHTVLTRQGGGGATIAKTG